MTKKTSIKEAILKVLSQKSILPIDFVKNNTRKNLGSMPDDEPRVDYAITRSLKNLVSSGLIEVLNSDHDQYFRLTSRGKQEFQTLSLEGKSTLVSTSWDGQWRIILLDLPESRKNERESLRYLLKKAGFVCLKNSVWISPYPFEHMFTGIKSDLGLTTEMIIIVTATLDEATEEELRTAFGMKTADN